MVPLQVKPDFAVNEGNLTVYTWRSNKTSRYLGRSKHTKGGSGYDMSGHKHL